MDLEKLRARRAGAINRPSPAAPPPSDGLVDALKESIATIEAASPRSGLAALTAEIAEASGGTVDDRRADVAPVAEAPAVALREAMAEDAIAAVPTAAPPVAAESVAGVGATVLDTSAVAPVEPSAKRGRGRPRKPRATLAVEDTIEAELDRAGLKLTEEPNVEARIRVIPLMGPAPSTPRPPTAAEAALVATLEEHARVLDALRQTLTNATVSALDIASGARNVLRAAGVRFEGDPS